MMHAVEVRIVFDDDGKTYLAGITGRKAEALARIIAPLWEEMIGDFPGAIQGPVLRAVTEITGRFVSDCEGDYVHPVPLTRHTSSAHMSNIVPRGPQEIVGEIREDLPGGGHTTEGYTGVYCYRFTCEAVRVPDPEKDAKEIAGLPEKKTDEGIIHWSTSSRVCLRCERSLNDFKCPVHGYDTVPAKKGGTP